MQLNDALERLPSRKPGRLLFASRRNGVVSTLYTRARVGDQLVWVRLRRNVRGALQSEEHAAGELERARDEIEAWASDTLGRTAALLRRETVAIPEFPLRPFDARQLGALKHAVLGCVMHELKQHEAACNATASTEFLLRVAEDLDADLAMLPARKLRRELVLYAGPPNSGKTHAAMQHLVAADSAVYLGPLRLLAMEAQEIAEAGGRPCSLITGEEAVLRPGAKHIASTVELANMRAEIACAVIDEAQLMADPDRGWAFVHALVGVPAKRVYITSGPEAVPLVERIARYLNEPLTVIRTERKGELRPSGPLLSLGNAKPGDAFIAFSRRSVMALRAQLLEQGFAPAVVYGALSPEVRRAEAQAFRHGAANVLVATDAIGLGLNLPVSRVVFTEIEKFDSVSRRELRPVEAWQIANRAGRFGVLEHGKPGYGEACAMSRADNDRLHKLLAAPAPELEHRVRYRPTFEQALSLHQRTGWTLSTVLMAYESVLQSHALYNPADLRDALWIARYAALAGLPFEAQFTYACAPVDRGDRALAPLLVEWMFAHAAEKTVGVSESSGATLQTDARLREAEDKVRELALYHWAARHFPSVYPEGHAADGERQRLNVAITQALARTARQSDKRARAPDWLGSCLSLESNV